ncbi:MAG: hypothetical protein ABFE13_13685 [Phycisphaerales bacterium]
MYTVDLLMGEGIPIRSRPGGIALACLIVVVPLLIGLGMTSYYLDGRIILSIEKQQLSNIESASRVLTQALKRKESLESEMASASGVLSEIKTAVDGYTQWSPTLASLVESLSDTLVLTRLEASQGTVQRKVPAKDDPARKVDVSIPIRTLKLCVCGRQAGTALDAVQTLQENLRTSPVIGPILDTITVSQSASVLDNQEAVMYELECTLKTGPTVRNN